MCARVKRGADPSERTISAAQIDRWALSVRVTLVKGWSKEGEAAGCACLSVDQWQPSLARITATRALRLAARGGSPEGRNPKINNNNSNKEQEEALGSARGFVGSFIINQSKFFFLFVVFRVSPSGGRVDNRTM